jgi:hypothetical protein
MRAKFWSEILKIKNFLEDLGIDSEIILKLILKVGWEVADWLHLAQGKVQ